MPVDPHDDRLSPVTAFDTRRPGIVTARDQDPSVLNRPSHGHNRLRAGSEKCLILVVEIPGCNHFVWPNARFRLTSLMLLCNIHSFCKTSIVLSIVYSYHRPLMLHCNTLAEKALCAWKKGVFSLPPGACLAPEVTGFSRCPGGGRPSGLGELGEPALELGAHLPGITIGNL